MANHNIVVDAWIREAEEGLRLVEDLENRIKNNRNPEQFSLRSTAGSNLLELGVKLDRLESLLHNPHSKPILTDEDLKFRWKMLSDIQLRAREVALSIYAYPSPNISGGLPAADAKEISRAVSSCQDQMKASSSKDGLELLETLVVGFLNTISVTFVQFELN
ncbi:syntaxin-52 [Fagus crenata]